MMTDIDIEKDILRVLEEREYISISQLASQVEAEKSEVEQAVSRLENRNLVEDSAAGGRHQIKSEAPVPMSKIAFRGELTPMQAIILHLYEDRGYGQTEIAQILDYSPGNVQTNIDRIKQKLDREL